MVSYAGYIVDDVDLLFVGLVHAWWMIEFGVDISN